MLLFPLGIASLLSSLAVFLYTQNRGGADATLEVSGRAVSGSLAYAVAALLLIAGVFFILSGVIKTIRRIAMLVAIAAIVGGGGVATLVPKSISAFERENNCVVFDGSCVNPQSVVRPLSGN